MESNLSLALSSISKSRTVRDCVVDFADSHRLQRPMDECRSRRFTGADPDGPEHQHDCYHAAIRPADQRSRGRCHLEYLRTSQ
jgi:hypothetical protein